MTRLNRLVRQTASLLGFSLVACGGQNLDSPGAHDGGIPLHLNVDDGGDASDDALFGFEDAGAKSVAVSPGTVTFRMLPSTPDSDYLFTESFGNPGDGAWWYSVATANGAPLDIFMTSSGPYCATCVSSPVPLGVACSPLSDAGVTATWDGFAITGGNSTCGKATSCIASAYMPPGQYVVTMCAGCTGGLDPLGPDAGSPCVSVPFQFPSSSEVTGTLPAP